MTEAASDAVFRIEPRTNRWAGPVVRSILAAMLIGGIIGILSGYVGGRFDMVVMQAMDVLLSFPSLIMGLMVVAMLGASMGNLMIAIALTAIAPFARIARAPTILVKERDYIEACRALGYSDLRIMTIHSAKGLEFPITIVSGLTAQRAGRRRGVAVHWAIHCPRSR